MEWTLYSGGIPGAGSQLISSIPCMIQFWKWQLLGLHEGLSSFGGLTLRDRRSSSLLILVGRLSIRFYLYDHLKYTDALLAFSPYSIIEKFNYFIWWLPSGFGGIEPITLNYIAISSCGLATRPSCLFTHKTNFIQVSLANF